MLVLINQKAEKSDLNELKDVKADKAYLKKYVKGVFENSRKLHSMINEMFTILESIFFID